MSVLESTSMLEKTLNNIEPLDEASIEAARHRLDRQAKPQGSLGKMEDICAQLAGIYRSNFLTQIKK